MMTGDLVTKIVRKAVDRSPIAALTILFLASLTVSALPSAQAQLPPSKNAPRVGEKAPDFTLPDSTGKEVRLYDLLSSRPVAEGAEAENSGGWVLLIFYRGYW